MEKHEYEVTSYGYDPKVQKFIDHCGDKQTEWAMNRKAPELVSSVMEFGYLVAGLAAVKFCNPLAHTETTKIIIYK